jgi:hypothetical protein
VASIRVVGNQVTAGAGLPPGGTQDFNFDLSSGVHPVGIAFSITATSGYPTNLVLQDTRFLQSDFGHLVVVALVRNMGPTVSQFGVTLTVIEA